MQEHEEMERHDRAGRKKGNSEGKRQIQVGRRWRGMTEQETGNTIGYKRSVNVRHFSSKCCDDVCLITGNEPWTTSETTLEGAINSSYTYDMYPLCSQLCTSAVDRRVIKNTDMKQPRTSRSHTLSYLLMHQSVKITTHRQGCPSAATTTRTSCSTLITRHQYLQRHSPVQQRVRTPSANQRLVTYLHLAAPPIAGISQVRSSQSERKARYQSLAQPIREWIQRNRRFSNLISSLDRHEPIHSIDNPTQSICFTSSSLYHSSKLWADQMVSFEGSSVRKPRLSYSALLLNNGVMKLKRNIVMRRLAWTKIRRIRRQTERKTKKKRRKEKGEPIRTKRRKKRKKKRIKLDKYAKKSQKDLTAGQLVLVRAHCMSKAWEYLSKKLMPRYVGPVGISKICNHNFYEVVCPETGKVTGKYIISQLRQFRKNKLLRGSSPRWLQLLFGHFASREQHRHQVSTPPSLSPAAARGEICWLTDLTPLPPQVEQLAGLAAARMKGTCVAATTSFSTAHVTVIGGKAYTNRKVVPIMVDTNDTILSCRECHRTKCEVDLPWRSRLAHHRSGVREALGSNPGQGMGKLETYRRDDCARVYRVLPKDKPVMHVPGFPYHSRASRTRTCNAPASQAAQIDFLETLGYDTNLCEYGVNRRRKVRLDWALIVPTPRAVGNTETFHAREARLRVGHAVARVRCASCSVEGAPALASPLSLAVLQRKSNILRTLLQADYWIFPSACGNPARAAFSQGSNASASEKQSSVRPTHKTSYNRVKRCRERKNKASEYVNVDVFMQNKRPCPQHSQTQYFSWEYVLSLRLDFSITHPRAQFPFGYR
ncbi:hypothetical protein PR048_010263 [Dryococelus australis]|uniref:Uncharacterized protein n=1 Tax=Dryococelus australis TaxID=614101 RepID=A0ABQ9I3C8_9NEOP|nr:hypothetical protein PR048_010263 [Dryococelus australis]